MTSRLRLPALSGAWLRAILAPALVFMATATDRSYLADFWHHLARGRAIVTQGSLVNHDLFTYTVPGRPFQDVNWLTQILYYELYREGGLALVQLVNAVALAAMMGLLVHLCWRASGSLLIANVLAVFTFFGLWQVFTIRPQTFSMLLFMVIFEILIAAEERPWRLLVVPAVLALWVNLHGAFPAGLLLIGGFLAAQAWSRWRKQGWKFLGNRHTLALGLCLVASVAATLANPYSWKIYAYVADTSSSAAVRGIDEWLPPSMDLLVGKVWVASLALLLALFALPAARPTARDVVLALLFLPLACGSVRMVAWWLLVIAPTTARLLAANLPRVRIWERSETPSFSSAAFFSFILLAVTFCLPGLDRFNPLLGPARRSGHRTEDDLEMIAHCLAQRAPAGRIFSRLEWAEYVTWSLGPRYTVFMDGRIEIFPDEVWSQYAAVTRAQAGWEKVLNHYSVNFLLLDRAYHARTGLLAQVEHSPRWQQMLEVGDAVLYVRRPAPLPGPTT